MALVHLNVFASASETALAESNCSCGISHQLMFFLGNLRYMVVVIGNFYVASLCHTDLELGALCL